MDAHRLRFVLGANSTAAIVYQFYSHAQRTLTTKKQNFHSNGTVGLIHL